MKIKVGSGFDAHRFDSLKSDDHFITLGGVKVPHFFKLIAHSDGDVVLHALVDALLGVVAAGDIGLHFPPSDPQWKNCNSERFVVFAHDLVKQKGGVVNNVDVTIICEAPRIGKYRQAMQESIARILSLDIADVNIKATTTEQMGFTGRGEGIAASVTLCAAFPY